MRVLYIDDDRVNTLLFVEACRFATDLTVDTAETGAEALTQAAAALPDVLVIDLHLPDTNGYALLAALRSHLPALTGMPAFLCTADDVHTVQGPALAAGFAGCWTKPVLLPALLDHLTALARQHPH
jgi:CheY-like chemotaxis protein